VAISTTYIGAVTDTDELLEASIGDEAYAADQHVIVVGSATANNNSGGFSSDDWDIDDDATQAIVWIELATTIVDDTVDSDFPVQTKVWISEDPLSAGETFDITIDPNAGGSNDYFMGAASLQLAGATGALIQAAATAIGGDQPATATFGSTPAGYQLLIQVAMMSGGDATWGALPTDFALVSGSETTATSVAFRFMESTANTATGVSVGYTGANDEGHHLILMELAEAAAFVVALEGFRVGDDGTEAGHGWKATQDAGATVAPGEIAFMRSLLDETGGGDVPSAEWTYQVKRDDEPASEWRAT